MDVTKIQAVVWWLLVVGLAIEVGVIVAEELIERYKEQKEPHRDIPKHIKVTLRWFAVLAAIAVLFAIIGEHHLGKLDEIEKEATAAENEAIQGRVARLADKIKKPPLKDRLRALLDSIDPKILESLESNKHRADRLGLITCNGPVPQAKFEELTVLAKERGASAFIELGHLTNGYTSILPGGGTATEVSMHLNTNLLSTSK